MTLRIPGTVQSVEDLQEHVSEQTCCVGADLLASPSEDGDLHPMWSVFHHIPLLNSGLYVSRFVCKKRLRFSGTQEVVCSGWELVLSGDLQGWKSQENTLTPTSS